MQAVIIAGGRGERLRPLTDNIPKSMVPIRGKPFLEHQLMLLKEHGITDFILLTGYLSSIIQDHFKDGKRFGVDIRYSIEKTPLGTGGALKKAGELISKDFLLINGDTLLIMNYAAFIRFYTQNHTPIVMTVYNNRMNIAQANISIDRDSMVVGYNKENPAGMTHLDSGVLAINKKVFFKHMPDKTVFSFEQEVYPKLIRDNLIKAYQTNIRFYDIGTPERLKKLEEILKYSPAPL